METSTHKIKSYLRIAFDGQPSDLMPLKTAIAARLECLRCESVLSQNLGEEDSVDALEVELAEFEDGTVAIAVMSDVDSEMPTYDIEQAIEKSLIDELNESKASGCFSEAVGEGNSIVLISPITTYATNGEENLLCHACGGLFAVDDNGVARHFDAEVNWLADDDLDHTPY